MTTEQDQQSRAAYEDGKWYWVEHEGWHGEPPTIAPACYKAECDAWYSYIFSGISTPYLKVLGPCERQAARALPAGMKPFGYVRRRNGKFYHEVEGLPAADFDVVYTAAQVQAMGRVPPGFVAAPVEPTAEMVDAAEEAYMPFGDMALAIQSAVAAAPRPPAAQERKTMACACGDEFPIDSYGAGFLDAKGKCFGCDAADEAAHGIKEAD